MAGVLGQATVVAMKDGPVRGRHLMLQAIVLRVTNPTFANPGPVCLALNVADELLLHNASGDPGNLLYVEAGVDVHLVMGISLDGLRDRAARSARRVGVVTLGPTAIACCVPLLHSR